MERQNDNLGVNEENETSMSSGELLNEEKIIDDNIDNSSPEITTILEDETPTEKAPVGDKGMEQKARKQDELIKQYREVMNTYKNKKEEEGDEIAKEYLKSKQDIVQKYLKMKKVKA